MSRGNITEKAAEFCTENHSDSCTSDDIRMIKLIMTDWIAASFAGKGDEGVQILLNLLKEENGGGESVLIGQNRKTSLLNAALLNGTQSHVLDFDDIHDSLSLHLSSPVCPAALAAAEYCGADGNALMNAVVNGIQLMVALSAVIMPEHYNLGRWHATGTIGIFGAAAAAGAVLGLSREQMCRAFGICAGLASGIQLNFGSMTKSMTVGMAAKNGLMAAILSGRGFTAREDIFDTDYFDNIAAKKTNPEALPDRLYGPYGIHELRFKRYPCGAPTHSGIINCRKILEKYPHTGEEISRIVFEPYPRAVRLVGNMDPQTGLEGKFSIAFTAAAQIVFGGVVIDTFTDENVRNEQVQSLMKRMELIPNDSFTPSRGGKATMYFTDGTSHSCSTYLLGHDLDLDQAETDVAEKYREVMTPIVGERRTETVFHTISTLERLENVRTLTALL